jgi:hypothetical protein
LLAVTCGRREGNLAGHATLSRLEMTEAGAVAATRYEKIEMLQQRGDDLLAEVFVEAKGAADPGLIVIDVDNSDAPLYDRQGAASSTATIEITATFHSTSSPGEHLLAAVDRRR